MHEIQFTSAVRALIAQQQIYGGSALTAGGKMTARRVFSVFVAVPQQLQPQFFLRAADLPAVPSQKGKAGFHDGGSVCGASLILDEFHRSPDALGDVCVLPNRRGKIRRAEDIGLFEFARIVDRRNFVADIAEEGLHGKLRILCMDFLEHLPVPYHDLMVKGFFLPALLIDPVCHSPYGQSQDPVEGKGHHQREDKGGDAQDKCNGRFLDPAWSRMNTSYIIGMKPKKNSINVNTNAIRLMIWFIFR